MGSVIRSIRVPHQKNGNSQLHNIKTILLFEGMTKKYGTLSDYRKKACNDRKKVVPYLTTEKWVFVSAKKTYVVL